MPDDEKKPKPEVQKSQADKSIEHLRCSSCLRDHVLHFNPQKMMFECTGCGADYLNPFAIGPWDKRIATIERFPDNSIVSAYVIESEEAEPLDPNENYLEFLKSIYEGEDLKSREVKDDWGLPTQAKKTRRKKKVKVTQEAE